MRRLLPIALAALTLAACGGGSDEAPEQPDIPGNADAAATRVVEDWAAALNRRGRRPAHSSDVI